MRKRIDRETTRRILAQVKAEGFSVTHLFEAAQVLAILAHNPVPEEQAEQAHVTFAMSVISLAKWRVPPYDDGNQLISEMGTVPIRVTYKDIPKSSPPRDRLLAVMRCVKSQYDEYIANPHFPHLLAAQMRTSPIRQPRSVGLANFITNVGAIENILPMKWYTDDPSSPRPVFDILSTSFGHRVIFPSPRTHVWSIHSEFWVQLQATDIWDQEYLLTYLDEIILQASLIISE